MSATPEALAAGTGAAGGAPGALVVWGNDQNGQLGDGTANGPDCAGLCHATPETINGVSGIIALAPGNSHTLALRADGTVWAWGINDKGQLGNGTTTGSNATPQQVPGLANIVAIAAGAFHNLALKADGTLLAWGQDSVGQLGDATVGTPTNTGTPQAVVGTGGSGTLGNVKAISAGAQYSVALLGNGTVLAWGSDATGQLGDGAINGESGCSGACSPTPTAVALPGGAVIKAISAGAGFALALKTDGTLLSWGADNFGQLGDGTATPGGSANPAAVSLPGGTLVTALAASASGNHALALTSTGTVLAWGADILGQLGDGTPLGEPGCTGNCNPTPTVVGLPAGVLATGVAAAGASSAVLTSRGRIVTWGAHNLGELGRTAGLNCTGGTVPCEATPALVPGVYNAILLAAGANQVMALTQPTTTYAWGIDDNGQLGDGTVASPSTQSTAQVVPSLTGVVAVAAGGRFSLALLGDGTVLAWGVNSSGQLGDGTVGTPPAVATPQPVSGLTDVVAIAAGDAYGLALRSDGSVWSWGSNGSGQLGRGSLGTNSATPAQVNTLGAGSGVVAIAAGAEHSLALQSDGKVLAWGGDNFGQLGDNAVGPDRLAPQAVVNVGGSGSLNRVVAIAAGVRFSVALKDDGTVVAWGADASGQLGDGTVGGPNANPAPLAVTGLTSVQAISAGNGFGLALRTDGTLWAWGSDGSGQLGDGTAGSPTTVATPQQVGGLTNVVAFAAGNGFALAVRNDGTVWSWGFNDRGELGNGTSGPGTNTATPGLIPGLTNVVAVTACLSLEHALALRGAVAPLGWGQDDSGQLGDGVANSGASQTPQRVPGLATARQISASAHTLVLTAHGTVGGVGTNNRRQVGHGLQVDSNSWPRFQTIVGLTDVVAVAAGGAFSLALRADGTVWSWGRGLDGELGDGSVSSPLARAAVQQVVGLDKVVAMAAGNVFGLALRADGTVWTWGDNFNGELGRGAIPTDDATAGKVVGVGDIVALAAGGAHVLALKGDGTLVVWGRDFAGQLGDGTIGTPSNTVTPQAISGGTLGGVVAVTAGTENSFARKADGTVWSWGDNSTGTLGRGTIGTSDPTPAQVPGLAQVAALDGGYGHAIARQANGQLWSWGRNTEGQLGRATGTTCGLACDLTPTLVPGLSGAATIGGGASAFHTLALVAPTTASAAPAFLAFADRPIGTTSAAQTITVSHGGPGTLEVMQTFVTGAAPGDFAITANTCAAGPLGAGSSCQLSVTFTPGGGGGRAATLNLSTSTAGAPLAFSLAGTGQFALATSTAGTGTGTVSPAGTTFYSPGAIANFVNVTATATGGSSFTGWTLDGAAAGSVNPLVVNMIANHTVVATFAAPAPSPSPSPSPGTSPTPSPSPSPGAPVTLTLSTAGTGGGSATPLGTTTFSAGQVATLTAAAAAGSTFTGWALDGTLVSWAPSVTLTMNAAHVVVATFQPLPSFTDVPAGQPFTDPVRQLAARGIINGCFTDPATQAKDFCPSENTLRHQMAALIARAIPGWVDETGLPSFGDNTDDIELMTRVATLQRHNVVRGYQADVCAERGIATPPGCYGPLDTVKYGQVMLFIARAMVEKGYWVLQDDDRSVFPDQNGAAGAPADDQQTKDHRMVVTYVHYVVTVPDVANVHANFVLSNGQGWGDSAPRAWFTRAFWPALESYFGGDQVP